jgi:hypothetical protein
MSSLSDRVKAGFDLSDRLRRYGLISGWTIGVAALLLSAVALDALWAFLISAAVLAVPAMYVWREELLFVPRAVMGFRSLQEENSELQEALQTALRAAAQSEHQSIDAFLQGELQGRADAQGQLAAHQYPRPSIVATRVMGDDLIFICPCPPNSPHVVGLRYAVMDLNTRELKGLVAVSLRDEEAQCLHVSPVQELTSSYWERLKENAIIDSSPPLGVGLFPYVYRNGVPVVTEDAAVQQPLSLEGPAS